MFVGHGLIAFALVVVAARSLGYDPERALYAGVLGGLFATIPDVDILYGPVGLVGGVSGVSGALDAFWSTGNVTHRGPTHLILFGAAAAVGFGWVWQTARDVRIATAPGDALARIATAPGDALARITAAPTNGLAGIAAVAVLVGLVALTAVHSGFLGAIVVTAFVVAGTLVAALAHHWSFSHSEITGFALIGLVTHPFGDLFTGTPPAMLYPFEATLVSERLVLHPDPTIHLLAAFGIEVATAWVALAVATPLTGRKLLEVVDARAGFGVAYGGAAVALPAPTLDASYQFVFSVLGVGTVGLVSRPLVAIDWHRAIATGLATVTLAAVAFTGTYLLV